MTKKLPSVFVCMPTYDTMHVATCLSLIKLFDKLTQAKIKAEIGTFKCPYVGYGRNVLTSLFLESGYDYQLFIDADMEFDPKLVGRMLLSEKDFICTPYRKKTPDNTVKYSVAFKDPTDIQIDNKGLTEIIAGPAGLTLISRKVYEKLMKEHPNLKIKQKEIISEKANSYFYNFWDTVFDAKSGYWWGEDTHFCNLARNAGFKFYAVADGETTHHGNFGFTGTLLDTFKRTDEKSN
tara:strand:+ start:2497 stop:3204 length:708 start_codon:yes stop_codon:yes gene_type:complete